MTTPADAPAPVRFYDDLAPYYDLIFEDWDASMRWQGAAVARLLHQFLPGSAADLRVLDVSAGIGTQSLPLAELGFQVSSRDMSPAAITRLQQEAARRGLRVDAVPADMKAVSESVSLSFDAVIAFDNAIAHLLSDEDLLAAFRSFHACLRPEGVCMLSVRDYDRMERGGDVVQAYGVRWRDGVRHVLLQAFHWISESHYDGTFYIIIDEPPLPRLLRTTTRSYAVSTTRLLTLMAEAGFDRCKRLDEAFHQPVLVGRKPPHERRHPDQR